MKILILEDEIPAYEKLLNFITTEIPNAQIVGWARSNTGAQSLLQKGIAIDIIFSDIELLDGTSFETFEAVKVRCPIIFCTGFDQYVLKAFQTNGIAYLLKPYTLDNFREAYTKYQTLFAKSVSPSLAPNVLNELKQMLQSDKRAYQRRFTSKKKEGIKLLETTAIVCFEANGDFCLASDFKGSKHVINHSLGEIENKVDPNSFFRINRSQLINIDFIDKIDNHFKNKLSISMRHLTGSFLTSSAKTADFRKWLER